MVPRTTENYPAKSFPVVQSAGVLDAGKADLSAIESLEGSGLKRFEKKLEGVTVEMMGLSLARSKDESERPSG
jgi:hypothetical protein